jgi:hypothetical protein
MAKKFHELQENDVIYRAITNINENKINITTQKLQLALDARMTEFGVRLFCYNLTDNTNIVFNIDCDIHDTTKIVYDENNTIKKYISTSQKKFKEWVNATQQKYDNVNIVDKSNIL